MASRLHWIDVLKGIGIFLVIMGHTFKDSAVYYWIYSFHIAVIFLNFRFSNRAKTSYCKF